MDIQAIVPLKNNHPIIIIRNVQLLYTQRIFNVHVPSEVPLKILNIIEGLKSLLSGAFKYFLRPLLVKVSTSTSLIGPPLEVAKCRQWPFISR